jgi:hypothetical protein
MKKKNTETMQHPQLAYGVTLVIPVRGHEPLLAATVRNARRTAGADITVIIVHDGPPKPVDLPGQSDGVFQICLPPDITGTSAARHAGIVAASTRIVATCDAHMDFSQGWAVALTEYFAGDAHANTVACAQLYACDAQFRPQPGKSRAHYTGARIRMLDVHGGETRALVAQWATYEPGDQIGAIMGAFYVLSRDWYFALGQPWAVGTGWGCDEELISLASWCMGGECRLLPANVRAYHVFERPTATPPTLTDLANVWLNRIRLLHVFPFPPAARDRLHDAMAACPSFAPHRSGVLGGLADDLARPECRRLRETMLPRSAELSVYTLGMMDHEPPASPAPDPAAAAVRQVRAALDQQAQQTRSQVIIVPAVKCRRCGAINSFAMRPSDRTIPATDHSPRRQFCRCRECNARAVRIFDGTVCQGQSAVAAAMNA